MAAVVAAVTLLQLPALLSELSGAYHDDAIYLVTARALAEGGGYAIESLPQTLGQTKYPVAFPAMLAAVWTIVPSFPENLPVLRLVPLLGMWLWMWLLWRLIATVLGRRAEARWIIALMLASPLTLYLGTQLLSETVFAATATGAILLLTQLDRSNARLRTRHVVIIALVCALAFHTRTIGVTLLPPALFVLYRRGGLRAGAIFVAIWLLACMPWVLWQSLHDTPPDALLAYYTKSNYGGWNLLTGERASIARVAGLNALYLAQYPAVLWGATGIQGAAWIWLPVALGAIACLVFSIRRHVAAGALYAAATLAILSLWAWPPVRFLVPVMPFVILSVCEHTRRVRVAWLLVRGGLALLVAFGLTQSVLRVRSVWHKDALFSYNGASTPQTGELMAGLAWVRSNTQPDAVIAANLDPNYWLYSGRKAVRAFAADPVRLFYTDDAPAAALGDARALRDRLLQHRVTHLVFEDLPGFRETEPLRVQISDLQAAWPGMLHEAWSSSARNVVIYTISW